MKILKDLVQGSPQWLAEREKPGVCCASEAPAMMNVGWMTRKQLLDLKKGAAKEPITPFVQELFDKGHRAEASAREILELDHCEDFPAVTGIKTVEGVELLASLDGLEGGVPGQTNWEHKLWNVTLASNVRNSTLEPKYYWQLEQQMLVSGGHETIFTCSDGTSDNKVSMMYSSVPERRKELIAGWKQFLKDLETHEIKAKQEVIVAKQVTLPAFRWNVEGTEIQTNIGVCLEQIKELAEIEMNKVLDSDQDFSDKDQLNKDVKKARDRLKTTLLDVEGMFVSYSQFATVAKEMDVVLQKMQSAGEKQVKQAKEAKKEAINLNAENQIAEHTKGCDLKIAPMSLAAITGWSMPDFVKAMKSKSNLVKIQEAVDAEIAKAKAAADSVMELIVPNLSYLREHAEDYKFLFTDAQQLVNQPEESFQAIVKSRISEHKEAEAKRLQAEAKKLAEAEREKIRKEEEKKAADKVKADAKKKADADRAEAKKLAVQSTQETNERVADKIIDHVMDANDAVIQDAVDTGVGVSQGGKRVDPGDFRIDPKDLQAEPPNFIELLGFWATKNNVTLEAMAELQIIIELNIKNL